MNDITNDKRLRDIAESAVRFFGDGAKLLAGEEGGAYLHVESADNLLAIAVPFAHINPAPQMMALVSAVRKRVETLRIDDGANAIHVKFRGKTVTLLTIESVATYAKDIPQWERLYNDPNTVIDHPVKLRLEFPDKQRVWVRKEELGL